MYTGVTFLKCVVHVLILYLILLYLITNAYLLIYLIKSQHHNVLIMVHLFRGYLCNMIPQTTESEHKAAIQQK